MANNDWNSNSRSDYGSDYERQNYRMDDRRWRPSGGRDQSGQDYDRIYSSAENRRGQNQGRDFRDEFGQGYGDSGRDFGRQGRSSARDYGSFGRDNDWGRMDASYGYEGTFGQQQSSYPMERDASRRSFDRSFEPMNMNQRNFAGRGPKGWQRSDLRIQEDVCETLERDPRIDASEIEVRVQDGIVTLAGSVEDRTSKRMAEDAIDNLSGVRDVRNEITVNKGMFEQMKDQVKEAFTGESSSKSGMKGQRSGMPSARR